MKAKDIRKLDSEQINEKLGEFQNTLFNLHFNAKTGSVEDPTAFKKVKRDIAKIKTVITEKSMGIR